MIKVLVCDDDQGLRLSVRSILTTSGQYEVAEAFDGLNAIEKVRASAFDVVILDVDMPRMNGLEALRLIKEHNPGTIVIMMTAFAMIEHAVQAVKDGAFQYLSKPVEGDALIAVLGQALAAHALISNVAASAPILGQEGRTFVGQNQQMQKVFQMIHRLTKVDTPVLVRGASGTGKELVARAIHFNSSRKDGKFVAINCSAIPENLFESELFGHEKGSFTGADQRKIGKFQYAEGGTLFLDEVGDLPQLMQVKLLRVLQEKCFVPVGSNREIPTNVRIVAATNRPLEVMMKEGRFREDLFYRLNVIPILLPSLCERKDDLENLIYTFLKKFNQLHGRRILSVAPDAMAVLKRYSWPGNIRELENIIEHAFIMESGSAITLASLPEPILAAVGAVLPEWIEAETSRAEQRVGVAVNSNRENLVELDDDDLDAPIGSANGGSDLDFNAQKEAFEKEFIVKALKTFKGRINQTAMLANIPKKTLLRKIEKYGINAKEYSLDLSDSSDH